MEKTEWLGDELGCNWSSGRDRNHTCHGSDAVFLTLQLIISAIQQKLESHHAITEL
jgi:hypothetical protein